MQICKKLEIKKDPELFSKYWLGANMLIPANKSIRDETIASLEKKARRALDVKGCAKEKAKLFAFIAAIKAYDDAI